MYEICSYGFGNGKLLKCTFKRFQKFFKMSVTLLYLYIRWGQIGNIKINSVLTRALNSLCDEVFAWILLIILTKTFITCSKDNTFTQNDSLCIMQWQHIQFRKDSFFLQWQMDLLLQPTIAGALSVIIAYNLCKGNFCGVISKKYYEYLHLLFALA